MLALVSGSPRASTRRAHAAWQWLLPKLTESDFTEWRRQRAWDARKQAMWDAGSNCRHRSQTDGRVASVVRRSASRMWSSTLLAAHMERFC